MEKPIAKATVNAADRATIFHEQYGNDLDAADALPEFVIAAGDYLTRIVGSSDADAGMAVIVRGLVQASGGAITNPSQWREALTAARADCYSEWKVGSHLHDLAAYAEYGIVLHDSEDPEELSAHIQSLLIEAQDLLAATPIAQWGLPANNALSRLVQLAGNRWAMDNGEAVEPAALAYFGGISEGRVRNLMSGENRTFASKDGKIPAQQALMWLSGRHEFWNSIWREQSLPQYAREPDEPLKRAVFLPVARDGSVFDPTLRRGSSYTIGRKGDEFQVQDFDEALAHLQRMPVPYWRRPNASGNWGSVAGVRWERFDLAELDRPNDVKPRDTGPRSPA